MEEPPKSVLSLEPMEEPKRTAGSAPWHDGRPVQSRPTTQARAAQPPVDLDVARSTPERRAPTRDVFSRLEPPDEIEPYLAQAEGALTKSTHPDPEREPSERRIPEREPSRRTDPKGATTERAARDRMQPPIGTARDDRSTAPWETPEPDPESADFPITAAGRRADLADFERRAPAQANTAVIASPPIITEHFEARRTAGRPALSAPSAARAGVNRRRWRSALAIVLILLAGVGAITIVQLTAPYTHGTVMSAHELADRVKGRLDEWGLWPR